MSQRYANTARGGRTREGPLVALGAMAWGSDHPRPPGASWHRLEGLALVSEAVAHNCQYNLPTQARKAMETATNPLIR